MESRWRQESGNICRWGRLSVYMIKPSPGRLVFPVDVLKEATWSWTFVLVKQICDVYTFFFICGLFVWLSVSVLSPARSSRWMRAVKKGKVYENESQIIHARSNKHKVTRGHTSIWLPPALCQGAICLGTTKRDLVSTLHWKSNQDSNEGRSLRALFVL